MEKSSSYYLRYETINYLYLTYIPYQYKIPLDGYLPTIPTNL